MKIILRILAIVAVAVVVAGIAAGIAQFTGSSSSNSFGVQQITDVQFTPGSAPAADFHIAGGGDRGGDAGFGLADLEANLFSVGWVLAAGAVTLRGVKAAQNYWRRRPRLSVSPS